jgi:N-acetylglutamate synthase-like GNAT family acetyltransferase
VLPPDFEISCDPNRIDVSLVHEFLRTSYWAEGRSRETVERSIRNSLCFGAYSAGRQIAFARVITDLAVFAYLADVFVVPEFRQRGVAKALMRAILAHPDLQSLRTFLLGTRDAHGLYAQFGFGPVREQERLMGKYASHDIAGA